MVTSNKLSPEDLEANWNMFLNNIQTYISSPRKEQLLDLYQDGRIAERIVYMPASSREHYHNCFPGGYVDHINNVVSIALVLKKVWAKFGSTINYTDEELVFAAINHDLGKIGTMDLPQYIENESEWHRKNQGLLYKPNPKVSFMHIPDRSVFILQQAGIVITENEYLGIRLHDGLYEEGNKAYLMSSSEDAKLRTNLPYILHQADMAAARIEYEKWKSGYAS